ncbi:polyamine ABC transporter substrate-binding protein [Albidovulum sediminis]|uniref:Putrescine-binding periplasmic protein n=1 Tax=Albidovulum sediminis TaxID=3066345 RepID=A0ABT2NRI1_9RHOB|nr:polyamine ABC transporter substrate-binding protein [Defluviimonas sediminis]MCT8331548.1 polyamine ABC transporter substrate-binding protein [Defluviimonas sediminis]
MKLSRRTTLTALGGALAMPYVRPSWAQAGTVNVYNWADYIGETTLADFEAQTGIGVVYDTYSSAEEAQAKMLAGSTGYDVVDHAGVDMPRAITAGIYEKLDKSLLPNWKNLDTEVLRILAGWDPGNEYGMPYIWGSVGFTYNVDMVLERIPDADMTSMDLIFKPENAEKLADCGISILDSPTDIMLMVLKYLGLDGDTTNVADYDKVVEAFKPIRQYIRTFDNTNYLNAIPNGELCAINNWSGDYATAAGRAAEAGIEMNLAYFVPKTGAPAWVDCMAIPSDAPNRENGYKFMNFLMEPQVAAGDTNYTYYATANVPAKEFILPEILEDPAVYPDAETIGRMWAPKPFNEEQDRAMTRAWQAIKTG